MVEKVFSYIIECALLNAYLLEKDLEPELHNKSMRGRKKRDYLGFRLDNTRIYKYRAQNCFIRDILTTFIQKQRTYTDSPLFSFLLHKIKRLHILPVCYCTCAVKDAMEETPVSKNRLVLMINCIASPVGNLHRF